ncbi:MAG: hypothetical protein A2Z43_00980 [Syntrophobacterales bacterium RBG_19FT_COMBO_59_10]|nr:MAG: hypothetical protein A2Z43_00980 [Syntrophobacterales bacterium RBG_19FT_COMBO_59_10]
MNNDRKYQRYTISQSGNTSDQPEVFIGNKLVRLVDFSVGGFYVVSESKPSGDEINISVKFGNSGRIDLVGRVVRVKGEGDMWGIAIDVSKNYKLHTLREV